MENERVLELERAHALWEREHRHNARMIGVGIFLTIVALVIELGGVR